MVLIQQKIMILHTSPEQKSRWLKLLQSGDWQLEELSPQTNLIELISRWLEQKIPFPLLLLIDMAAQTPDGHFLQATALSRWCKEQEIPLNLVGLHSKQETISHIEANFAKYQGLKGILPIITDQNYPEIVSSLEAILGRKLNLLTEEILAPVKEVATIKEKTLTATIAQKTPLPTLAKNPQPTIQQKTPLPTLEKTAPPVVKELAPEKSDKSLEFFNDEIKDNSKSATLYCQRGDLYFSLGNEQAAFADYQQAIQLDSKFETAYFARGVAFYKLGNYVAAIKNLDQALKLNGKNPLTYHQRGLARFHSGDEGGAQKDYDQALKLKPDFSPAYNDRAFVLYLLGKTKEALQNYDLAIKYNPHSADPYYNRGNIYSDLARFEEAIEDYTQAIRCNPNLAEAYGNRGIAYYELDQVDLAIQDTNKSALLFKNKGAIEAYRQALETLKEMKSN